MDFHTTSFDAIGVTNTITVTDAAALPVAGTIAERFLASLDDACSRFREDSELARLNRAGSAVVSPLFLEALGVALVAARDTDGVVDPTVGASLRSLGYDRDFDVVVRRGTRTFSLVPAAGWGAVSIGRSRRTVRLQPGTELDLGATAKAFAADAIAAAIHAETESQVLVSLGGDVAVAGQLATGGWPVLVSDSSRLPGATGQTVEIRTGGLATSSTTVRRWVAGAVELHHIVDPATGAPAAERWRTVSVAAPTCVAANVAATAAIVLGDRAPAWLGARRLAARLVRPDGSVIALGGWPAEPHALSGLAA
jgi:thiamine biosynthesis lipoprotein